MSESLVLVCFAVKEETAGLPAEFRARPHVQILLTGMGRENAARVLTRALASPTPSLVLSCGFAGGLDASLQVGDVVFDADPEADLDVVLPAAGARRVRFHTADRVAVSAAEKRRLRRTTEAEAVDMESATLRSLCRERHIPSATVRVISDAADEDLPLDFNRLMGEDRKISLRDLLTSVGRRPWKIRGLLQLQNHTRLAANRLGATLAQVIPA